MKDDEICEMSKGLTFLVDHINTLTPQCPANFRHDSNKFRFLRAAVVGQPWASRAVSQITNAKFNFKALVTALREGLQLHEEKKTHAPTDTSTFSTMSQQYGRPTHSRKQLYTLQGTTRYSGTNPIARDGTVLRCHNCGSEMHLKKDCKEGNANKRIRSQLRHGIPAVNIVDELGQDLEACLGRMENGPEYGMYHAPIEAGKEPDEAAIFEVLVGTDSSGTEPPAEIQFFGSIDTTAATNYLSNSRKSEDSHDDPDTTLKSPRVFR